MQRFLTQARTRALSVVLMATAASAACAGHAAAQRGDKRGEQQAPLPDSLEVPPAPVLSPADGLRSLHVQPGFRVELVAAEPLVVDPVAITFDARGRIWAVEMRGFMPNVDGTGELTPNGRIVTLSDTDGDGVMDKSQVFLDKLVLPRLVSIVGSETDDNGVLVLTPPQLLFCRDTDGDGRCDEQTVIRDGLPGRKGPEHAINGGMVGLDNWIQFAKFGERLRRIDGAWVWQQQLFRGQWGITQDDAGRHFHNGNSDYLRGDLFPAHYAVRFPEYGATPGANIRVANDQSTWPIRITPGINRGYMKHMLRDYKLARFTAACSPVIYRDEVFPKECHGDAFVCEPAGNFVRRAKVERGPLRLRADNAYAKEEFLASTDERFRPVDLKIGPDGGLYVVDFYRGILQHKVYVTSFLRKQIVDRKLATPLGLGRIYRVLPTSAPRRSVPDLTQASDEDLIAGLSHGSGWWRDTAQRLLIQRGRVAQARGEGPRFRRGLLQSAVHGPNPLGRLHALWTLEGLGAVEGTASLFTDPDPRVRAAAIRVHEPRISEATVRKQVVQRLADDHQEVVLQAMHSLGAATDVGALVEAATLPSLDNIQAGAIASGLRGRVIPFCEHLVARGLEKPGRVRVDFVRRLAVAVLRRGVPQDVAALVALASADRSWVGEALCRGLAKELSQRSKKSRRARVFALPAKPGGLLARAAVAGASKDIATMARHLAWPEQPMVARKAVALSKADTALVTKGRLQYTLRCFACHGMTGKGQPGVAPPLVGSPRLLGPPRRVIPMLIHGLKGPIEVDGKKWDMLMPAVPGISDEEVAAILSYVRRSFGHDASVVQPGTVRRVRKLYAGRTEPMTPQELDAIR